MPRDIPLTNGRFYLNFDAGYAVRDIYFPCCATENHSAGHPFRFGIWVDGSFSWMGPEWSPRLDYRWESLVSHVIAENPALGIRLHASDAIDYIEDLYIKKLNIFNLSNRERDVRVFFHQDFHINETTGSDTAYYDPDEKAVIHYKQNRYFLIRGSRNGIPGFDQFTTGIKEFRKLEGAWRDAEDGALSGNTIAQGSVDSVVSFQVKIPPGGEKTVFFWIAAGVDYQSVSRLGRIINEQDPELFMDRTDRYWRAWVNKETWRLERLPARLANLFKRSLLIIRTNVDNEGAILAALDFDTLNFGRDTYGYMWPRDAAYTSHALDKAGFASISRRFFEFCRQIMLRGKERGGYFLPKYMSDGSIGSSWHPWVEKGERRLPIQEDSTGLVLWSLWNHYERFRDVEFASALFETVVIRCADFMSSYIDPELGLPRPSYDLWEERWGIYTFTCSAVYAGLIAAAKFALLFAEREKAERYQSAASAVKAAMEKNLFHREENRFLKGIYPRADGRYETDMAVDASAYAPFYLGLYPPGDEKIRGTMESIRKSLCVGDGRKGIARYEGDDYYRDRGRMPDIPGNPWNICTLWTAQWLIAAASAPQDLEEPLRILADVAEGALLSGVLGEQTDPFTGNPVSASPLTWSHATLVAAVLEYLEKLEELA
jgi:GH15 family glucan-1,4-alpha-glucosidase